MTLETLIERLKELQTLPTTQVNIKTQISCDSCDSVIEIPAEIDTIKETKNKWGTKEITIIICE